MDSIALSPQIVKVQVPAPVGEQSGLARVAGTAVANIATRYLMKAMFGDLKAGDEMFWKGNRDLKVENGVSSEYLFCSARPLL